MLTDRPSSKPLHDRPGNADIKSGVRHPNNDKFILHDSEGLEPGGYSML
jgi:hypothetical protein